MMLLSCSTHNSNGCKETELCLLLQAEAIVSKHNRGICGCEMQESKLRKKEGQAYSFLKGT
jgi:hypothetical protein